DLDSLTSLPVERFALPTASVDVMRVRLEETYDIAGVGKDTVELKGWIAVTHDNPRPGIGQSEVKWGTAVSDTEFVSMDLHGESPIFGPVHITLDKENTSKGRVGKLELPFVIQMGLDSAYREYRTTKEVKFTKSGGSAPVLRGEARAVAQVLNNVMTAISNKDAHTMLSYYAKDSSGTVFGKSDAELIKGKSADFETAIRSQFDNIRRIKVIPNNDINIKVNGNVASANLTGVNDVIDIAGRRATSPWQWTVQLQKQGDNWAIVNDKLTFVRATSAAPQSSGSSSQCVASVAVNVEMPKLDLKMRTKNAFNWYSEVETIPPVGYTASVSFTPTPMVSAGRQVGTLQHGVVKFREIVRHVALQGTNPSEIAAK
ncbi:MAG TPA: DUF6073 family protein, partial [Blastocatellia bacterium]